MVQSLWNDGEAGEFIARYGRAYGEDLALRVYTSRLIGRDEDLVLHGGGNTSVKTRAKNLLGEELDVLAIKGSGWNLVDIEPAGLPLVELEPLRKLFALASMSDAEMVNEIRRGLLDSKAPIPSVETLLHAALPHKFVDHTHADAILTLTNQADAATLVEESLGDRVGVLPWTMPGYPLAQAVLELHARRPELEAVVLLQHGIFSFADDARESYERMIRYVRAAEDFVRAKLEAKGTKAFLKLESDTERPSAATVAQAVQIVRGAVACALEGDGPARMHCSWRDDETLRAFSLRPDCRDLLSQGPITPDHVIRTKGPYLFVSKEQAPDRDRVAKAVEEYVQQYGAYFKTNAAGRDAGLQMLDPLPRVVFIEGWGMLSLGVDKRAAEVAADIAQHSVVSKAAANEIGHFRALPAAELFEMEYWSLEQAKLGKKTLPRLAGQIALISGAAGAIGVGIAECLAEAGAAVVLTDLDLARAENAAALLRERLPEATLLALKMDVTDEISVGEAFAVATLEFGGIDIVVPNAGMAHVATLEEMEPANFRQVMEVNLTGTMILLSEAARVFRRQGSGGAVVVQASKNVFAPGAAFGAYSASKAGQHQLGKIAALEFAELGVRVNMVNADAVFGDAVPSGLWEQVGPERMKSRGLDEKGLREFYRERSLLKKSVTPRHVGEAVLFLVSDASAATTGVTLTVDGGIAAAFPR
jgi:rhamnose utilization protein RhaD (predicted bifunctional aldolase and dehydrogenase)/NAD(P)-dependent dehydrogenase (short-subunit alcohol dehydrogenase family)